MVFYHHFTLLMDRSPSFGSTSCNLSRPIQTRSRCGSVPEVLNLAAYHNSPDRSTKSTISSFNALYVLVNARFQVLFHSPSGVLFTFPSQYCSTIGHQVVFRLGGWSPRIPCGFLVSARTLDPGRFARVSITGLSPSSAGLPIPFFYAYSCFFRSVPRAYCYPRFGLFRFRSPLLTKSRLMSLPPPT